MQYFYMVDTTEFITSSKIEGVYNSNNWKPKTKWKQFLKKHIERFLSQEKIEYISKKSCFNHIRIDENNILEQLRIGREILARAHHEARHILVGRDTYYNILGELNSMLTFTSNYFYDQEVMGMKITVIPWMEGVVVLPKEFK